MTDKVKGLTRAQFTELDPSARMGVVGVRVVEILATLDAQDEMLARLAVAHEAMTKARRLEIECRTDFGFAPSILCDGSQCHPCEVMMALDTALSATPEALTTWLQERDRKAAHEQEQTTLQAFGLVGGVEYREGESTADAFRRWKQEAFARGVEAAIAKVEQALQFGPNEVLDALRALLGKKE